MELYGLRCGRGEQVKGRVRVGELYDGTEITMPVRLMQGAKDGPTVLLMSTTHGDEYNGTVTINRLCQQTDPATLSGAVIGLPIANPLAFVQAKRVSDFEYERLNMNRVFPGNPRGFQAERIADMIFTGMRQANYMMDYHEGGRDFMARYLICNGDTENNPEMAKTSRQMAAWFGMGVPALQTNVDPARVRLGRLGTSNIQAGLLGVPGLVNELGGAGTVHEAHVRDALAGTRNLLKGLGMLPGEREGTDRHQHIAVESMWPRPDHGGFLVNHVAMGDVVAEGHVVATVQDVFGEPVEELRSPYPRAVVLDIRHTATIMPGEWSVHLGRLAD